MLTQPAHPPRPSGVLHRQMHSRELALGRTLRVERGLRPPVPVFAVESEIVDSLRARADRDINIVTCITLPSTHEQIQDEDRNIADFVVYVGEPGE